MRSWSYDEMESEVRKLAHSLPPSDFGSTRAIQAVTAFVFDKLREASRTDLTLGEIVRRTPNQPVK
jgi:hypothetical protein